VTTLGVVSAGGRSTRFGSPKALATVGGRRVVDRVISALSAVVGPDRVVVIANDPALGEAIGLPFRGDTLQDIGALAGVHAALLWARERGDGGAIVAGCDMPFIQPALLDELLQHAADADVVIPGSEGPRGVEPLCAWYGLGCIPAIEAAAAEGDARMIGFHRSVRVHRVPLERVQSFGDVDWIFRNINTQDELAEVQRVERAP
jgi:molybdopterin-guanine dinucleotide biosynthesis protein A